MYQCWTSLRFGDAGEADPPLTILLINNGGGSIFSFLPIADTLPADTFNRLWTTPQNVDLSSESHSLHAPPVLSVLVYQQWSCVKL